VFKGESGLLSSKPLDGRYSKSIVIGESDLRRVQYTLPLIVLALSFCSPFREQTSSLSSSVTAPAAISSQAVSPSALVTTSVTRFMPEPSPTQSPSLTPSPVPTLSPDKLLSVRFPNDTEIWNYLDDVLPPTEPGPPRMLVNLEQKDLSGDSVDDLIIIGNSFLVVQVWMGDQYGQPFVLDVYFGKYDPSSRANFEDWTLDGIPEVVFEVRTDGGGTGVRGNWWDLYIISCGEEVCKQVWSGLAGAIIYDTNFGGIALITVDVDFYMEDSGTPTIVQVIGGYEFFCCSNESETSLAERLSLRIRPVRVLTFLWNGERFAIQSEEEVSDAISVEDQSIHTATRADGTLAEISVEEYQWTSIYGNDLCSVLVDGVMLREGIGCKGSFSSLRWLDLTGDSEDELVYIGSSGRFDALSFEDISEYSCVHQRLLAFQVRGDEIREITNIEGCIVDDDLFGVRLVDGDQDGDLEILAARYESEEPTICLSEDEIKTADGSRVILQRNCWSDPPPFRVRIDVYAMDGGEFVLFDSYLR
jgi:hypothetical protein